MMSQIPNKIFLVAKRFFSVVIFKMSFPSISSLMLTEVGSHAKGLSIYLTFMELLSSIDDAGGG